LEKKQQSKLTKIIFIIWCFFISFSLIFLLIIFLFSSNHKNNLSNDENKIINNVNKDIETYNRILKKAEKKIDGLSKPKPIIYYNDDGKTIHNIEEFNPSNGKKIKSTYYNDDGITIDEIHEFDPSTGKPIKLVYYNDDGTIQENIDLKN
jgi:hypothetical protein